ncbi:hypothetical protein HYT52_04080 [Candidatus Woesearchaeota archaeon]|nr:hypothetical protein [Candidatus Woesearchaeota archaeon]
MDTPEQTNQETPAYILSQSKARALVPKILSFFVLGVIFYLGVLLNLSLLELSSEVKDMVEIGSVGILVVVIILGIYLAIRRAWQQYLFYSTKIVQNKKSVEYVLITNVVPKKNLWDKMFKTQSYPLTKEFSLKHISDDIQLQNYLQQLVDYANRIKAL